MLVACRLAELLALEAHHGDLVVVTQFGRCEAALRSVRCTDESSVMTGSGAPSSSGPTLGHIEASGRLLEAGVSGGCDA
jgi:hypothetical protein